MGVEMEVTFFCDKCDKKFENSRKLLKHIFLHKLGIVLKDE